ncbi:MAG: hypothetical protein CMJ67_03795 [Planctomycetaceae bacterium]|nr:hypothetical protein [Planctomycetaceae bacterium]
MRPPSGQSDHGITPFQVRLVVVVVLFAGVILGLGWQLRRLTADDAWRTSAEKVLSRSEYVPTIRGPILDRAGRPLAVESASMSFEAHFETITGDWAYRQARRDAKREIDGEDWSRRSESGRHAEVMARLEPWQQAIDEVWMEGARLGGIDAAELRERQEDVKSGVGRLRANIWERRYSRLEKEFNDEASDRFEEEPIAEEKGFHAIVDGLDYQRSFPLIEALDALDRRVREAGGNPERDPAFRIRAISRRERGSRRATVVLDRSTLPTPIRSDQPIEIEVVGVADTIVGTTRDRVTADDVDRRPFREKDEDTGKETIDLTGYDARFPSLVGSSGLEREFDRLLHGSIGYREENIATSEMVIDNESEPGGEVRISLDSNLQARVRAILDPALGLMQAHQWQYGWNRREREARPMIVEAGTDLHGAVVVLDVKTGETLALVSTPALVDLELTDEDYELLLMPEPDVKGISEDEVARRQRKFDALSNEDRSRRDELIKLAPFRNRAIATEYAPGSIVKPLMYVGGVENGVLRIDEAIECKGYIRGTEAQNLQPRCWGWRPRRGLFTRHGLIGPVEAISKSCNIYFYTIADRLGPGRVHDWYVECGLEADSQAGLNQSTSGTFDEGMVEGEIDRMIVGIGQGPIAWTPLHAATAYARLAMGGAEVRPKLVLDPETDSSLPRGDWNSRAVSIALEGMLASAREGTANAIQRTSLDGGAEPLLNFPELGSARPMVWAKTGTAQVKNRASHAWYAGLVAPAGDTRPRYAFAVIVEHGNSGGAAAGPVASQVIRALAAEGYLGEEARQASGATPVQWHDEIEAP